jgi:hypothetical protein
MTELSIPEMGYVITDLDMGGTHLATQRCADEAATESAQLGFEATLRYRFPVTMTEAEVRDTLVELANRLGARAQCHLIIDAVPREVIPTMLPQLWEMAEYEVRMWQVRQEVEGPDIRERWVSLPITA